jgi:hypothetical protein
VTLAHGSVGFGIVIGDAARMPPRGASSGGENLWRWDPSLCAGSASYYTLGRVAYPRAVPDELVAALGLDGSGRLLDIGCGPGSLTLVLAPRTSRRPSASTPTPTCSRRPPDWQSS